MHVNLFPVFSVFPGILAVRSLRNRKYAVEIYLLMNRCNVDRTRNRSKHFKSRVQYRTVRRQPETVGVVNCNLRAHTRKHNARQSSNRFSGNRHSVRNRDSFQALYLSKKRNNKNVNVLKTRAYHRRLPRITR